MPEIDDRVLDRRLRRPTNSGFAGLVLKEWAEREQLAAELQQEIQALLNEIAGVQAFVFAPPSLPGAGGGLPIQWSSQSIGDPAQVYEVAEEVKQKAQASGRFIVVQNSLAFDAPQVHGHHRSRPRRGARRAGQRDRHDARRCWSAAASISQFDRDFEQLRHHHPGAAGVPAQPGTLGEFFVRARRRARWCRCRPGDQHRDQRRARGDRAVQPAQLGDLFGAAAARRHDGRRSATSSRTSRSEMHAGGLLHRLFRPVAPGGAARATPSLIAFGLAIIVIYLVLAAQFESFRDPFIIMMSVPLSIFGAISPLNLGLGDAEHLHAGRADHPGRADHQARHPDGRVRQPAAEKHGMPRSRGDRCGGEGPACVRS